MKEVTSERLVNAAKEPQNWMTYFGTYNAQRYSALNQITRENVKQLAPRLGFSNRKIEGGLNAAPLVVDGVMYLVGSYDRVFALDAVTGKLFWTLLLQIATHTDCLRHVGARHRSGLRPGLYGHARQSPGRARCQDRQRSLERRDRRQPEMRLQRERRAHCRER